MKIKIFIAVLIVTTNVSFSQDYIDDIALKACECVNTLPDTLEPERFNMDFGFCIINAASPYKKQLKEDYEIDFNKIEMHGEELGRVIVYRMTSVCPDALMIMANKGKEKENNNISENIFEGQVTDIIDDKFVEFSIRDEVGKISKFYWFTFIESNTDLSIDYKTLIDKFVEVTFISQEYFDATIGEYRTFYIIQKLNIIKK